MMTRLICSILSLITLWHPAVGWGRDNLSNPTVYPGNGINNDPNRCQIVNVYSYSYAGDRIFAQVGVGWVIQTSNEYRILLPAHVVAGAELLAGKCGSNSFALALKGKSETLDLALLDIVSAKPSYLFPLISTQDRNEVLSTLSGEMKAQVASLAPEHTTSALMKAVSTQEDNYYLVPSATPNNPTPIKASDLLDIGFAHIEKGIPSLFLESLAIRPGFSGSPLFITSRAQATQRDMSLAILNPSLFIKPYLAGMLTKAEINGSRSLGVSLIDILAALPRLLATPDADAGRPLRLRYSEKINNGTLERKQELVQSLSDGSQRIYSEVCNDSSAESSEWNIQKDQPTPETKLIFKELSTDPQKIRNVKPDDLMKTFKDLQRSKMGNIQQERRGGDYGEGGGSLYALKNATFMIPIRLGDYAPEGELSSYKIKKNCDQPMVQDQYGKKFDSITASGRMIKTTSLNELYNALTSSTLGANSCVRTNIGVNTSALPTPYKKDGEIYFYARYEGYTTQQEDTRQFIDCNGGSTRVKFNNEHIAVDADFSRKGTSQGSILFKSSTGQICQIQLSANNTRSMGNWKQIIRTKDADIDVSFGSEDRAMSFKVLRTSAACNPFRDGKLWMYEINFSDTLSKLKKVMGP
ncbi:MAG: hypothetical protein J7501_14120 [Bdellovibrio sp.]|nr:hypothetical protein [Bdellovibrio sp.]